MSIICLNVGQCGNQVGSQLYNAVIKDCLHKDEKRFCKPESYVDESLEKFFTIRDDSTLLSRCVQVDMEDKVVRGIRNSMSRKSSYWSFCKDSYFVQKQGSGNNWARAYKKMSDNTLETIENMVTKQLENCDFLDGLLVTMSLAGGTGSGIGSRLCEHLREVYPKIRQVGALILPYHSSDVTVQSYNVMLGLNALLCDDKPPLDAALVFRNDLLHEICCKHLQLEKINMTSLNELISLQLLGILQPAFQSDRPISEAVASTVLQNYPLLQIAISPYIAEKSKEFSSFTWQQLFKYQKQSILSDGAYIMSSKYFVRGKEDSFESFSKYFDKPFNIMNIPIYYQTSVRLMDADRTLIRLYNARDSLHTFLDQTCFRAWKLFRVKAFLHHYCRFGLKHNDFFDTFANVEQILANYKAL